MRVPRIIENDNEIDLRLNRLEIADMYILCEG